MAGAPPVVRRPAVKEVTAPRPGLFSGSRCPASAAAGIGGKARARYVACIARIATKVSCVRAVEVQCRAVREVEGQDAVARRHHASGDAAAGIHAAAGRAGATPAPASGSPLRRAGMSDCFTSINSCWRTSLKGRLRELSRRQPTAGLVCPAHFGGAGSKGPMAVGPAARASNDGHRFDTGGPPTRTSPARPDRSPDCLAAHSGEPSGQATSSTTPSACRAADPSASVPAGSRPHRPARAPRCPAWRRASR